MDEQAHHKLTTVTLVIAVLAVVWIGYKFVDSRLPLGKDVISTDNGSQFSMMVNVENTLANGNVLVPPENFPREIPYEAEIVESAISNYPRERTK